MKDFLIWRVFLLLLCSNLTIVMHSWPSLYDCTLEHFFVIIIFIIINCLIIVCVCFQSGTFHNDSFFIVFVVKPNDFDCNLIDTISHVQRGE